MSKKRKIIVGVVLGICVLALAGLAVASGGDGTAVRTEAVDRRDLMAVVTASGYIQPKRKVDISADISGRVIELPVEEGQWVGEGDLLLRIDPTSYQAAMRRAEAAVAQARAQEAQARANWLQAQSAAERAEQLAVAENLISAQELEQARTQEAVAAAQLESARFGIAQAEAALSEAHEMLRKTTIDAPMSGRITRLNIEQGETAVVGTMNNPGSLLLTVADPSEMEARVEIDETDVPHISLGDSAGVEIDAFPGQTFAGRVTQIANSAIQAPAAAAGSPQEAVDFEVVITLSDPPEGLRPDLSATADIVTESRRDALAVPIIAVTLRDPDGQSLEEPASDEDADAPEMTSLRREAAEVEGVFVVREGVARFVPVEVGIAGDRYFEVREGLEGGETVISGTYQTIRDLEDGDPVEVESSGTQGGGDDAPAADSAGEAR